MWREHTSTQSPSWHEMHITFMQPTPLPVMEHYSESETIRNDDGFHHHDEPATVPNGLRSYASECRHVRGHLAHSPQRWILPLQVEHWKRCAQGSDITAWRTPGSGFKGFHQRCIWPMRRYLKAPQPPTRPVFHARTQCVPGALKYSVCVCVCVCSCAMFAAHE